MDKKTYTDTLTVNADLGPYANADLLEASSYVSKRKGLPVACLYLGRLTIQCRDTSRFRDIAAAFIEAADKADALAAEQGSAA